ncbi:MAG TPA: hypothetical protein PK445_06140 [Methanolinea sp.]|jgi:branched-subunit amino acid ABC-type transport system permease component|nr:hypothetical protein [Methanolinea sp.]HOS82289.1 hypothetical protein [Methanolinea sp.]HPC55641.1 hypothetical protein [Methanolinea sp.]HQE85958.1 hypothetical protein [Methanolinea sp.]HQI14382.1 hypothetical protein [Methanolinea sp.]
MTPHVKKSQALAVAVVSALAGIAATLLTLAGVLPPHADAAAWVIAFPAFVLGLYLYWMAREGDPDIPFVGY